MKKFNYNNDLIRRFYIDSKYLLGKEVNKSYKNKLKNNTYDNHFQN